MSGQIEYFKRINFINGEYFLIKREVEPSDVELYDQYPIQIIYTGTDLSWEQGFSRFVDALINYKPTDSDVKPVSSKISPVTTVPPPDVILAMEPDEIRQSLASATDQFFVGNEFNYSAYKEFCKRYDYAIHLSTRISPGTENDKWLGNEVIAELGKGNFGKVYAAQDGLGNPIAIKVAHADVRDDEAMLNSFRRGVASMKYLSNSNISGVVKLIDASELPPSIIMEYVQGIDLEKFILENYNLEVTKKLQLAKWVSEVLFECHNHERVILHRDLRPSNVMISGEYWEELKKEFLNVLDFDLSWFKGASGSEFYMNATQALGFLAPEQLDSKSRYSTKTALVDVYGIGMLLYFIISAEIPLANASTRTDWPERMEAAARKLYCKDWKSNAARAYRLIKSCTSEAQEERPTVQDVIFELDTLIGAFDKTYPFDDDSVIEELICRLSGERIKISYDRKIRRGGFISGGGTKVEFSQNEGSVWCILEYVVAENTSRSNRGKYLTDALARAVDKISKLGEIDKTVTGTTHGGSKIKCRFTTPSSLKTLNGIEEAIQGAISEMALKA